MVLGEGGERLEKARRLPAIAAEVGATPAQLAIAWCLANPNVSTVMLGASRKEQLEQNLGVLDVLPRFDLALKERIEQALA
jgi:aryl-alcohol dehydrogenase-like predicted oxidoreductase